MLGGLAQRLPSATWPMIGICYIQSVYVTRKTCRHGPACAGRWDVAWRA